MITSTNIDSSSVFSMQSGLFGKEALTKETPNGFTKIIEGTTAVLFPPAAIKGSQTKSHEQQLQLTKEEEEENYNNNNNNTTNEDGQAVFYNPAQVVNRDLSVCVLACFSQLRREESRRKGGTREGITILEALSATGLRAIRYYKEIPGVRFIIANDMDADAVNCIRRNCEYNEVPCVKPTLMSNFPSTNNSLDETSDNLEDKEICGAIIPNLDDANDLMFRLSTNPTVCTGQRFCVVKPNKNNSNGNNDTSNMSNKINEETNIEPLLQQELMDVVDLDPYGSASPFLDGAMRCIKEGGLLLVTSTDSAILCGNYPDTCHAKYNSVPTKNAACHEMAVRILLASIERVANKHRKYIVPLLSLHIDFYVRCFVRVYTQPAEVKLSSCKLGYLLQCSNCPSYWVRPMAVARTRSKKRSRENNNNNNNNNFTGNGDNINKENSNECNMMGNENNNTCKADILGRESFPATPLRQENPKISCINLQQMFPSSQTSQSCCLVCGSFLTLSGPIYAAPTQSHPFLTQLLKEIETRGAAQQITASARISGLVRLALEELSNTPLFLQLPDIASFVRVRCPPTPLFVGALKRLGYKCSQVHCSPAGIKTDCPPNVLVAIMLQWKKETEDKEELKEEKKEKEVEVKLIHHNEEVKEENEGTCSLNNNNNNNNNNNSNNNEVKKKAKEGNNGRVHVRGPLVSPLTGVDFSYDKKYDFRSTATGIAKFIPNAPNWGPKRRHQGAMHDEE